MRENGFQRPYNTMQVATWILLPVLILQFLLFVSPVLPIAASVPCTILFVGLGFMSAYQAYKCCVTNPIDDRLVRHLERQRGEGEGGADDGNGSGNDSGGDPTKYCWVCQTDVHDRSMHCKFCDKCVSNFDHHCMWLNTCVGSANYGYFYNTVVVTFVFVLVHSACLAGVVVPYFVQAYGSTDGTGGPQVDRMRGWFGADVPLVVAVVNIVFLLVNLVSLSLIGQLLHFHIGLRREGITTYEYIVRENGRKREKSKAAMEVRAKRLVMLRAARNQGDRGTVCQLEIGRVCLPCDPARKAVEEDRRREREEKERKDAAARGTTTADEEEGIFHHEEDEEEGEGDGASGGGGSGGGGGDGDSSPDQPSGPVQVTSPDDDGYGDGHDGVERTSSSSDAPPPPAEVAPEQPRPSALQEAMASREDHHHHHHDGGSHPPSSGRSGAGACAEQQQQQPEFISVGVTECTHPSANAAMAPSDSARSLNADGHK